MAEFAAAVVEPLDEAECLRLISAGGVGRIGYSGRYGPTVLPVCQRKGCFSADANSRRCAK